MTSMRFIPNEHNAKSLIKHRRLGREIYSSLRPRGNTPRTPIKPLQRMFMQLHTLACHSPDPVHLKWKKAYNKFYITHFGSYTISSRYANKYSCHSWM